MLPPGRARLVISPKLTKVPDIYDGYGAGPLFFFRQHGIHHFNDLSTLRRTSSAIKSGYRSDLPSGCSNSKVIFFRRNSQGHAVVARRLGLVDALVMPPLI